MAKVYVTVKSVEAVNAKMQACAHSDVRAPVSFHVLKPAPPSRADFAEAGRRALQSFKRVP